MSAPDISAEAVERLAKCWRHAATNTQDSMIRAWYSDTAATLRALRAALDAAERERDAAWQSTIHAALNIEAAADATGYAIIEAVLALLPATAATKETRDE